MTSDHFRQFLIPKKSGFGGTSRTLGATDPSKKVHLIWALVAGGAAYTSWQVSKWHSSFAKDQAKRTLIGRRKKNRSKS
jgi:hypothetical protein